MLSRHDTGAGSFIKKGGSEGVELNWRQIHQLYTRFTSEFLESNVAVDYSGRCESTYRTLCAHVDRIERTVVDYLQKGSIGEDEAVDYLGGFVGELSRVCDEFARYDERFADQWANDFLSYCEAMRLASNDLWE